MEYFSSTNMHAAQDVDGSWIYYTDDGGGDYDAVLWAEADGWKATANPLYGEATRFDLGPQPDGRAALARSIECATQSWGG